MSAEKAGMIILSIVSFIVLFIVGVAWINGNDDAAGIIGVTYCAIVTGALYLFRDDE